MKKESFDKVKNELVFVLGIFFVVLLIAKLIFAKESFFVVFRTIFALFWLIILPGYFAMLYWVQELKFYERLIIGIVAATAITGLLSYYTGLLGVNIKYHIFLLPIILIIGSVLINFVRK